MVTATASRDILILYPHILWILLCVLLLHRLFPLPAMPYPSCVHLDNSYLPFKTQTKELSCPPWQRFTYLFWITQRVRDGAKISR